MFVNEKREINNNTSVFQNLHNYRTLIFIYKIRCNFFKVIFEQKTFPEELFQLLYKIVF